MSLPTQILISWINPLSDTPRIMSNVGQVDTDIVKTLTPFAGWFSHCHGLTEITSLNDFRGECEILSAV